MQKLFCKEKIILYFVLLMAACSAPTENEKIDTSTVKNVEIEKYMGTWYEIARFPHAFEKNLVGVTATYTLLKNGKIEVQNQGYEHTLDGKLRKARGKAKMPDKSNPGKLKVSFFWFFYAPYHIMEVDVENYQWALVGTSSNKYLWILGRTPQMDAEIYEMLVMRAKERGYKIDKLQKILH